MLPCVCLLRRPFRVLFYLLSCCCVWWILSGVVVASLRVVVHYFSLICSVCVVCHSLFALRLGALVNCVSVIVALT